MSAFERALRREHDRELRWLESARGSSASRPIEVTSAAVIEPRTAALSCPRCGGEYRIHEHTRPVPGLRKVDVACRHCSTPRSLWFRLVDRAFN